MTPTDSLAAVGAVSVALYAAHQVADHWIQTSHQAATKGAPGWRGRAACAAHVATYTVTAVVALTGLMAATGWTPTLGRLIAGLGVSAASHYWAERRTPLAGLCDRLGKTGFYQLGAPRPGHDDNPSLGTGAYALDQAWHVGWLFIAALLIGA